MHATLNAAGDGFTTPAHIRNGNQLVVARGGLITAALMLVIIIVRYTAFKDPVEDIHVSKLLGPELHHNRLRRLL
jgi:hypothetical protein